MKLEKDDFGIWDNDDEELSIIKEGYTSRQLSEYILYIQEKARLYAILMDVVDVEDKA